MVKKTPKEKTLKEKPTVKKSPVSRKRVDYVFVQFGSAEWQVDALKEKVVAAYTEEGHRASSIKHLSLYVKPEDGKVYYVINDKATGSVDL